MTPLFNFASNITPAQLQSPATWGAVLVPELQAAYGMPNGTAPSALGYNAGGVPFPGPMFRAIRRVSWIIEGGAGITGGSLRVIGLRPDGNWHIISVGLTIAASTNYFHSLGPGVSSGSFTMNAGGIPLFGLALNVGASFAGGNINYLEVLAMAEAIDPGFMYGTKLGALIQ